MNNKEIYKKTLTFSIRQLIWNVLSLVIVSVVAALGFAVAKQLSDNGIIGLALGIVFGIVIVAIISRFISYVFKAGQIAMMTKAIDEGKLPNDVYGEGKKIVKERFLTVAAYYAVTGVIKGIFNELGRAITGIGKAVGGDNGQAVGSAISSAIQTVVRYLCDCCLGWVFYRKDEKATKATMEGAVLFFKHGKTFAKNMGRVFGMGALSLLAIGGVFFGIFYLVAGAFPGALEAIANEMAKTGNDKLAFLTNVQNVRLMCAGVGGILMWSFIHSAFVRPFVLVGVLRNYIESGKSEKFSEADMKKLEEKSPKFKKLRAEG